MAEYIILTPEIRGPCPNLCNEVMTLKTGLRLLVLTATLVAPSVAPAQIYVDASAASGGAGTSWNDAFADLQDAIAAAIPGDQIWVARGTYYPDSGLDQAASFQLTKDMQIYGGFDGTETLLSQRDLIANVTVLSGDLGIPSDNSDNSYHVVWSTGAPSTAVLDGFTITAGNATMPTSSEGGGILVVSGDPTLRNLLIDGNSALNKGGGLSNGTGNPTIEDVVFTNNQTTDLVNWGGGGMYNGLGAPALTDVLFENNTTGNDGGGFYNDGGSPLLTRVTFRANVGAGAGFFSRLNGSPVLDDCLFENHAVYAAGVHGSVPAPTMTLNNTVFRNNIGGGIEASNHVALAIDGCTFDNNGSVVSGIGAINCVNSVWITASNCDFTNNTAIQSGGAISGGTLDVTDCTFIGNSVPGSGALGAGGAITAAGVNVSNTLFVDNSALRSGGAVNGSGTFVNVVFLDNHSSDGGALSATSNVWLTNVTMVGNTATRRGAAIDAGSVGVTTITNTIIWHDGPPPVGLIYQEHGQGADVGHSLIKNSGGSGPGWDTTLGSDLGGNIDAIPQFVDLSADDFRLRFSSPAVNAGSNAAPSLPADDFLGNPRISGGTVDIGAYELTCPATSRLYVDADAVGSADGSSWTDAMPTLTEALAFLCGAVTEVWVAEGAYRPTAGSDRFLSFALKDGVSFYGGFQGGETSINQRSPTGAPTVLSGDIQGGNSLHVVDGCGTDATAVLDGFYVSGGFADGTVAPDDMGAGILIVNGSPTIRNVIVEDNIAVRGGGMAVDNGSPIVVNAVFDDNTAVSGGGGLYTAGGAAPVVTNATFSNNFSTVGGAVTNNASAPEFHNTIMWGNATSQVLNQVGSTPTFHYSLVQGSGGSGAWNPTIGIDGGNNVDGDPLFVDGPGGNFRLVLGSPAVGWGDNNAPNILDRDLDGLPRIKGTLVDMGPFELHYVTGIDEGVPAGDKLVRSIYPNPFNPQVTISIELARTERVRVHIFDVRGKRIRELLNDEKGRGRHDIIWDARDDRGQTAASGVYFVIVESGAERARHKITLLK